MEVKTSNKAVAREARLLAAALRWRDRVDGEPDCDLAEWMRAHDRVHAARRTLAKAVALTKTEG